MLDIAIIGGGPAGLAAGLYAVRGGASVRLYEEMFTGGQIVKTHQIDNYPGISDGPDGYALAARFEEHATKFGLPIEYGAVSELDLLSDPKRFVFNGKTVEAKTVILATGASPKSLGIPGEKELTGHGISYCATAHSTKTARQRSSAAATPRSPTHCILRSSASRSMWSIGVMRFAQARSWRMRQRRRRTSHSCGTACRKRFSAKANFPVSV